MLVDVQIMRNEKMDFFEAVEKHLIRWDYEFVPAGCGPVEHLAEDDDVYMIIRQVYQTDQCEETPELILFECADLAKYFDYVVANSDELAYTESRYSKRLLILDYMQENKHKLIDADAVYGYWWMD